MLFNRDSAHDWPALPRAGIAVQAAGVVSSGVERVMPIPDGFAYLGTSAGFSLQTVPKSAVVRFACAEDGHIIQPYNAADVM